MDILTKKTLRKMNRIVSVFVTITTIVWLSGIAVILPAKAAITDGSLIRATGDYKVYIVNGTYKRWIQTPDIFKFYKHLGFAVVQDVSPATRDSYNDSWMVRADGDTKVYEINGDGSKHWLNMTAEEFTLTGHKWAMVYIINTQERDWYSTGAEVRYTGTVTTTPTPTTTATPIGNLTVSLSANTPASATLPTQAVGVPFIGFNLTAGSSNATVTDITLTRTGAGAAADFSAVYLYEGDTRLTNGRSISSDTNTVTFSNLNLAVSSGVTRALTVKADISSSMLAGRQDALGVSKVNGTAVTGVNGNLMNMGNVTNGTATVAESSASWTVNVGTSNAEVAKFTIQAGNDNLNLHAITLTNAGSLQNSYITNLRLQSSAVTLGSVTAMNGSKATIILNSDYTVPKNQTKSFTVLADLTGGRRNDTVIFYVDQAADVNLIDAVYGYGPNLTNNFNSGDQTVTMTGGTLTLALNGPAAGTIGKNITNQTLMKFNTTSADNITVKDIRVNFQMKLGANVVNSQWSAVKNAKIIDTDSNTTLMGPLTDLSAATSNSGTTGASGTLKYYKVFNDTFDIAAGATRHLAIQADIDSTFDTTAADSITADIDISHASTGTTSDYVYDNTMGQYMNTGDIVPNTLTGNQQTVAAASLTVAKGSAVNRTVVKGADNVEVLGLLLTAGTADSLQVNKVTARLYASSAATFSSSGYGDTAANSVLSTVSLYEGSTLVKGPINMSLVGTIGSSGGYYQAQFTGLSYALAAGAQKSLSLQVKVGTNISSTTYVAADVKPSADIEVQDSKGNLLTNLSTSNLNLAASPSPLITLNSTGYMTAAVDGTTPLADIVVSGSTGVDFTHYKFTATNEAFVITGMVLKDASSNYDGNIAKLTLVYPTDASGITATKDVYLSNGSATISDGQISMYVGKDKTAVLTIKADLKTLANGATSGGAPQILIYNTSTNSTGSGNLTSDFIAVGQSSGTKVYGTTGANGGGAMALDNTNVKAQTVRKTKVVAKVASDSPSGNHSVNGQDTIAIFQFDATSEPLSSQNSTLTAATLQITGGLISGSGNQTVRVRLYSGVVDSAHEMTDSAVTTNFTNVTGSSSTATSVPIANLGEFPSTVKVYVVVDTTDADFTVGATGFTKALVARMTSYTWNDGSVAGVTPVTGIPVIANTLSY